MKHNLLVTPTGIHKFFWILKIISFIPLWIFLKIFFNAKDWDKFIYGLISHKCEYPNIKYDHEKGGIGQYLDCKHYGCNIVHPLHADDHDFVVGEDLELRNLKCRYTKFSLGEKLTVTKITSIFITVTNGDITEELFPEYLIKKRVKYGAA